MDVLVKLLFGDKGTSDIATSLIGYLQGVLVLFIHAQIPAVNGQSTVNDIISYALVALFALGGRLANSGIGAK